MIVPLFVIITVMLIMLDLFMHDTIISRCTAFKSAMTAELKAENETNYGESAKNNYIELEQTAAEYLREKTIALSDSSVSVKEEKNQVSVIVKGRNSPLISHIVKLSGIERSAVVKRNTPDNFVRTVSAIRNAIR